MRECTGVRAPTVSLREEDFLLPSIVARNKAGQAARRGLADRQLSLVRSKHVYIDALPEATARLLVMTRDCDQTSAVQVRPQGSIPRNYPFRSAQGEQPHVCFARLQRYVSG